MGDPRNLDHGGDDGNLDKDGNFDKDGDFDKDCEAWS